MIRCVEAAMPGQPTVIGSSLSAEHAMADFRKEKRAVREVVLVRDGC